MFNLLIKLFVKNHEKTDDPVVRGRYGKLTGITGIILNIILCTSKIVAGLLIGAISIVSDGINNLSDAGSSVITLLGFKLSAKKPDKEHPFGHGRIEYFAGLAVSGIIIFVAIELMISSIEKIIAGEIVEFASPVVMWVTVGILLFSICVKLWMALFNRFCGKKIDSVAMMATSLDSVSDCVATTVVLICTLLSLVVKTVPIDGYAGVAVSLFIAFTGIKSIKEVADVLLGQAPDEELVKQVADYVLAFDEKIVGIHDLVIHDYGPGRKMIILHAEVPAEGDILELHDVIDNIEAGLQEKFNCMATIHMDPVITTSERVNQLKTLCKKIVKDINPEFNIHDFRMNEGETHANVIFDVVITHDNKLSNSEIETMIDDALKAEDSRLNARVKIELPFV